MKKLILTLMILLTGIGAAVYAQNKPQAAVDAPKFKFSGGDTYDFGKVKKGPVAEHTFEFVNVGTQPLIIMDVTPSCSCTKVEWDHQPIAPGAKGKITLGVKTSELTQGVFNKAVYIRSNAFVPSGEKRYTIYMKGESVE